MFKTLVGIGAKWKKMCNKFDYIARLLSIGSDSRRIHNENLHDKIVFGTKGIMLDELDPANNILKNKLVI